MLPVIPIKLERESAVRNTKIVDWRLSNVCNFNCSFCPSEFKDGSKRPLPFETYTSIIDNLSNDLDNKFIWFQFTGGEPTLYPKLIELLTYIKNKNGYTSMISNGSRTMRWWKTLAEANVLDRLYLSYHPEQVKNPLHIIEVNNLMQESNTFATMFITTQYHETLFQKAVDDFKIILENANTICSLKPISDETKLQPYSKNQLKIIQENLYIRTKKWQENSSQKRKHIKSIPWNSSSVKLFFNDNTVKTHTAQYVVESGLNKFQNWECDIGKDLLVIEIDEAYRGMCRQGGIVGSVLEKNIFWQKNSIICQKENCNCSLDVQEPKRIIDNSEQIL